MAEDVVGKVYGLLTVLVEVERKVRHRMVRVRCSCENATEKTVRLSALREGSTISCGCAGKAAASVRMSTHGLTQHPMYNTWANMLKRCQNSNHKSYKRYGGRGIVVCESWNKFENFYADMHPTYEEGLSLDRKDNNQGYSPENCRWANWTEQAQNRQNNVNITIKGKTQCLAAWCEELNLKYSTVYMRIDRGQSAEQALSQV